MIFADLLAGEAVFVDANTLVYHFSRHPQFGAACTALIDRIERRELPARRLSAGRRAPSRRPAARSG